MPMKQGPPRPRPEPIARPVDDIESIRKVVMGPGDVVQVRCIEGQTIIDIVSAMVETDKSAERRQRAYDMKHDGKPLPSSVDRLKADEAAKVQPKAGSAIEELLDACDELETWMPTDPRLQRLINGAMRIRRLRDELPEPMDGHR